MISNHLSPRVRSVSVAAAARPKTDDRAAVAAARGPRPQESRWRIILECFIYFVFFHTLHHGFLYWPVIMLHIPTSYVYNTGGLLYTRLPGVYVCIHNIVYIYVQCSGRSGRELRAAVLLSCALVIESRCVGFYNTYIGTYGSASPKTGFPRQSYRSI